MVLYIDALLCYIYFAGIFNKAGQIMKK